MKRAYQLAFLFWGEFYYTELQYHTNNQRYVDTLVDEVGVIKLIVDGLNSSSESDVIQ